MAKVAKSLFDPACIHHMHAAEFEIEISTGLRQRLEDMGRLIGADVDFPAQLAHIGDAVDTGQPHADLNFLSRPKGVYRI